MASRVSARRRRGGSPHPESSPPSDLLAYRCRTLVRRGEYRKAAHALRQLAQRDGSAAAWVRLGVILARCGKHDASLEALKQGRYIHRRAGQRRRADVVARLTEQLRQGHDLRAA